uniref:Iron-related transcription factor 3 bHLH domain-containing protein n=1 Tax=Aegilops tauschii subsp. strangulata TaxID=200361 RepID=A0A453AIP6_AEGTS
MLRGVLSIFILIECHIIFAEADRQTNGKACILTDTTRILRDLLSQLESLRKENSTLQNESHYVTMERNELQDENSVLRN